MLTLVPSPQEKRNHSRIWMPLLIPMIRSVDTCQVFSPNPDDPNTLGLATWVLLSWCHWKVQLPGLISMMKRGHRETNTAQSVESLNHNPTGVAKKCVLGLPRRKEFKDSPNKPSKQRIYFIFFFKGRDYTPQIVRVGRPGDKQLHWRTKSLRILLEWGHGIFKI